MVASAAPVEDEEVLLLAEAVVGPLVAAGGKLTTLTTIPTPLLTSIKATGGYNHLTPTKTLKLPHIKTYLIITIFSSTIVVLHILSCHEFAHYPAFYWDTCVRVTR